VALPDRYHEMGKEDAKSSGQAVLLKEERGLGFGSDRGAGKRVGK
jgi:hypothetical protein